MLPDERETGHKKPLNEEKRIEKIDHDRKGNRDHESIHHEKKDKDKDEHEHKKHR